MYLFQREDTGAGLTISILGGGHAEIDGEPVQFKTEACRAVIAYLIVNRDRYVLRQQLAEMLWPGLPSKRAYANLRQTIRRVNTAVAPYIDSGNPLIITTRNALRWDPRSQANVDLLRFYRYLDQVENNAIGVRRERRLLQRTLACYGGDLLRDTTISTLLFEEWLLVERERLKRIVADLYYRLCNVLESLDDLAAMTHAARSYIAFEPWHEDAYQLLMQALIRQGRRSAALQCYAECKRVLLNELDVAPDQRTEALVTLARNGCATNSAHVQSARRRQSGFAAGLRSNIPAELDPIIGRDVELRTIERYLTAPGKRLVTLTGVAGVGKTHLAIEAARRLRHWFADGARLVCLGDAALAGSNHDRASVVAASAATLNLSVAEPQRLESRLFTHLRRRELLLILDGADGVPALAQLVADLLQQAPHLTILCTARTALEVDGEWRIPIDGLAVPPLSLTSIDAVSQWAAPALLTQYVQRNDPRFRLNDANIGMLLNFCYQSSGIPRRLKQVAAELTVATQSVGQPNRR